MIKKKLEDNYLFGCIKYTEKYNLYLMPIAYWILNYSKYDPMYNPKEWEYVFRGNVLNVTNNDLKDYLYAVGVDKVDLEILSSEIVHIPKSKIHIHFFVDFDKKLFVNSFPDVEVEEYLPDSSWRGVFDSPLNYLPDNIKSFF